MTSIDWSATGSMIGGIGSIIAVGVAIALSETQHRRTIRLVTGQENRRLEQDAHHDRTMGMWAALVISDLRRRAAAMLPQYDSITISTNSEWFDPKGVPSLTALLDGLSLHFDAATLNLIDSLPRFPSGANQEVARLLVMTRYFDLRHHQISCLLRSEKIKTASLQKAIKAQGGMLRSIIEGTERAYTSLASEYNLVSLEEYVAAEEIFRRDCG